MISQAWLKEKPESEKLNICRIFFQHRQESSFSTEGNGWMIDLFKTSKIVFRWKRSCKFILFFASFINRLRYFMHHSHKERNIYKPTQNFRKMFFLENPSFLESPGQPTRSYIHEEGPVLGHVVQFLCCRCKNWFPSLLLSINFLVSRRI